MRTVLLLVLVCVCPVVTHATNFLFVTVDAPYPGASETVITGVTSTNTVLGIYADAGTRDHGFRWPWGGVVNVLLNVIAQGINERGQVVGRYTTDRTHGFVFQAGTFTPIDMPVPASGGNAPLLTEALGVNDHGLVVGYFRDGDAHDYHGFLWAPMLPRDVQFQQFDMPGASATIIQAINNGGTMVGQFIDNAEQSHALRIDGTTIREVAVPGVAGPFLTGITDSGILAGTGTVEHVGFIKQTGIVQVIQVPGSTLTEITGVRNDGTIYGRYVDVHGVNHGFVGFSDGTPAVATGAVAAAPRAKAALVAGGGCLTGDRRQLCRQ